MQGMFGNILFVGFLSEDFQRVCLCFFREARVACFLGHLSCWLPMKNSSTCPSQGMSGFWIGQVSPIQNLSRACHNKYNLSLLYWLGRGQKKHVHISLQQKMNCHSKIFPSEFRNPINSWIYPVWEGTRKGGFVPQIGSKEESALLVLVMNPWLTGSQTLISFPSQFTQDFACFSLGGTLDNVSSMLCWDQWTFVARANDSVCTQSCPTPPCRSAGRSDQSRAQNVQVWNSTG